MRPVADKINSISPPPPPHPPPSSSVKISVESRLAWHMHHIMDNVKGESRDITDDNDSYIGLFLPLLLTQSPGNKNTPTGWDVAGVQSCCLLNTIFFPSVFDEMIFFF